MPKSRPENPSESSSESPFGPANRLVLGIETSCDETAVAIVDAKGTILANRILSQFDDHKAYGGVVPEIAARAHISHLDGLIRAAMDDAGIGVEELDAIAATTGPGLVGGLMVGVLTAKAMAQASGRPFLAVNHLAGHALTPRLTDRIDYPYLLMLASGGHCQILSVEASDRFTLMGSTIDDAAGEAFDKTAKLLGLGQPGGPQIEKIAKEGDPKRFDLPRPMKGKPHCDFSFSGLKTAVRRTAEPLANADGAIAQQDVADLAASFQAAVTDCITDRLSRAISDFKARFGPNQNDQSHPLVVAGGVAANQALRTALESLARAHGMTFIAPPLALCTDNAAMIAWAAQERLMQDQGTIGSGKTGDDQDDQSISVRPRWPLDETANPRVGSGRKGRKV